MEINNELCHLVICKFLCLSILVHNSMDSSNQEVQRASKKEARGTMKSRKAEVWRCPGDSKLFFWGDGIFLKKLYDSLFKMSEINSFISFTFMATFHLRHFSFYLLSLKNRRFEHNSV